nr:helix-turn-helix domain-containing protein [Sphaerochaetaceae bacterium]
MGHYRHLTLEEREMIMALYHEGRRISEIARIIGRNRSTISRELKRNR